MSAAAAAAAAGAVEAPPSLAPSQLLPPLVSAYMPSQPPPSIVDLGRQAPSDLSTLQVVVNRTGEQQSVQVRRRVRVTDGVRLLARKKKSAAAVPPTTSGLQVREMPERVDVSVPESGLINQLLAIERRLDATIARKHLEMQYALHPVRQPPQLLRIFVWHEHSTPFTHEEMMNGLTPHDKPERSAWLLKLQGQVLDTEESSGLQHALPPAARCLSNYLSAVVVQIEGKPAPQPVMPPGVLPPPPSVVGAETIEWRKHSSVVLSDGFEIRRRGGEDVTMQISLFLDYSPPRFRLSPGLAHALAIPLYAPNPLPQHATAHNPHPFPNHETQSAVLSAFWQYVRKHGLSDASSPDVIRCDATLHGLFGVWEIPVSSVLSFLQMHLAPAAAEPIIIPYHIRPSLPLPTPPGEPAGSAGSVPAPSPSPVQCFDILTYAPVQPNLLDSVKDATAVSGLKGLPPPNLSVVTARQTDKLQELLFELDRHNRRREFLQCVSESPSSVMQLLASQHARDNLVMMGITGVDDELERRAEFYHAEWQYDAIDAMLQEEANQAANAMQTSASMWDDPTANE